MGRHKLKQRPSDLESNWYNYERVRKVSRLRHCRKCHKKLSIFNLEKICFACQEKMNGEYVPVYKKLGKRKKD